MTVVLVVIKEIQKGKPRPEEQVTGLVSLGAWRLVNRGSVRMKDSDVGIT